MFMSSISSSYGLISNVSEYFDEKPNLYKMGSRIMEFVADPDDSACTISNIKISDTDLLRNPDINSDDVDSHLFVVLIESASDSYRKLQIALPDGDGHNGYWTTLYREPADAMNAFYVIYDDSTRSSPFVVETMHADSTINEDEHFNEFLEGNGKFKAYGHPVKPGNYYIHSVLFKSGHQLLETNPCIIILDWKFSVSDDGAFSTKTPQAKTGMLINITDQFSLKQQLGLGLSSWEIICKEDQSVLSQKEHFFHERRIACVTPETKTKLVERGWNLAAPTSELAYFEKSQEREIGQKFEDFMKKQGYNNVPSAFVIGKYNFNNDGSITYFCGEFRDIDVNYSNYFNGAIDGSGTLKWDGIQKQSAWCAINDDAHQFSFTYDWELENED